MKFKVDENLPEDVVGLLQDAGHNAASVPGQGIGGALDATVFDVCQTEGRILVTLDLDFANVQAYPPATSSGIIVLRLGRQDRPHVLRVLERMVPVLTTEDPKRRLWIVEEDRIRVRS